MPCPERSRKSKELEIKVSEKVRYLFLVHLSNKTGSVKQKIVHVPNPADQENATD